jgi:hypothetical protein
MDGYILCGLFTLIRKGAPDCGSSREIPSSGGRLEDYVRCIVRAHYSNPGIVGEVG